MSRIPGPDMGSETQPRLSGKDGVPTPAAVLSRAHVAREDGLWYKPTPIEPCSTESEIIQSEVFDPVLTLQTFGDESQAVALANSTPYGLPGIVYTRESARAQRIRHALPPGTVWINSLLIRDLTAPFAGCGIGREGDDYALDFHSDLKTLQIREGSTDWARATSGSANYPHPSAETTGLLAASNSDTLRVSRNHSSPTIPYSRALVLS